MSFDSVPPRAEVMRWSPLQLADYLRKMDLGGCDKVIMKCGMNGQRFLSMTDNDIQKFPKIHTPLITKICQEINKKEEKRPFFTRKTTTRCPEPVAVQEEDVGWDSDEFIEDDDDYESPDSGSVGGGDGSGPEYETPPEEGEDSDNDNGYELPPSEADLPRQIFPAKPLDSDYIDNTQIRGVSVKMANSQPPIPPVRPGPVPPQVSVRPAPGPPPLRREQSPQRPFRPPNKPGQGLPPPLVNRSTKPTTLERGLPCQSTPPERDSPRTETTPFAVGERFTPQRSALRPPVIEKPQRLHKPPIPATPVNRKVSTLGQHTAESRPFSHDHRNDVQDEGGATFSSNTFPLSARSLAPRPSLPPVPFDSHPASSTLPSRLQHDRSPRLPHLPQRPAACEPQSESEPDLDPRWYVGQATRPLAEGNLRRINQDGTFLVRDSSRGSPTQPYTLMVLYHGRVYNIQIRYNGDDGAFLLGTGNNSSENFPRVIDIIKHHMHTPLLLIEAKVRRSSRPRQCLLTHPAGY